MIECKAKPTAPNRCVFPLFLPHSPHDTHPALLFIVKSEKNRNIQDRFAGHFPSQTFTQQPSDLTLFLSLFSDGVSHCRRVRSVDTFLSIQRPAQASHLRKWELDDPRRIRGTCLQRLNATGAKDKMLTRGSCLLARHLAECKMSLRVISLSKWCWEKCQV